MSSGTSYNGWPANSDSGAIGINSGFTVDGMKFPGGIKSGDVQTVFTNLIRDLVKIDPPDSKEYNIEGFWGYSYKQNTNNPSQLSCHASGTAIDYRAVAHPNVSGSDYIGWSSSQVSDVKSLLLGKYSSLVGWLPYDSMHFEINGNSSQIKNLAATLGQGGGDWFDMASQADLEAALTKVLKSPPKELINAIWNATTPRHAMWKDNEVVSVDGRTAKDTIAGAENNTAQLRQG